MTSPLSQATKETHICPKCGVSVVHLEKHLKKAHDPKRVAEKAQKQKAQKNQLIDQKNFGIIEKARQVFLNTPLQCTHCSMQVSIKLLPDHFFKIHQIPLTPAMRALYGLAERKNMFKTSKEREDYWRTANGIKPSGDDIFDRGMTVQGGAYGLGKNRKH